MVKAGDRLRSRVCTTEVIVVRAPSEDVTISCCGVPMAGPGESVTEPVSVAEPNGSPATATLLGKRYADKEHRVELLCVKAGNGPLTMDGEPLSVQTAKPLPASD